jgi:3-hydroxyacyl-[acyl-carrier-protein] dehydratase
MDAPTAIRLRSAALRAPPPSAVTGQVLFDADEIGRWVPHRPPMLLLDGIVALEEGLRCTSVRRVGLQEPFVSGHFPGSAIIPGVYFIENIAQTACFLGQRAASAAGGIPVLARVERCTFSATVSPPAELVTEVVLLRKLDSLAIYAGTSRVKGRWVCKAEIIVGRAPGAAERSLP